VSSPVSARSAVARRPSRSSAAAAGFNSEAASKPTRGPHDTDVSQDARVIKRFRWQSAPFSAWLFRIRTNLPWITSAQPSLQPERVRSRRVTASPHGGRGLAVDREQSMLEADRATAVEQQQVLTLKFVFNLPNADVATILDKTEGAVKSLQHARSSRCRSRSRAPRRRSDAPRGRIVGLPSSGKSALFHALTGARATRRRHGGRSDPRLAAIAGVIRRVGSPCPIRSSRCADGPSCSGTCARWTHCWSFSTLLGHPRARDDLETLRLELLVADRDHIERRSSESRSRRVGRAEAEAGNRQLERCCARRPGGTLADCPQSCRPARAPHTEASAPYQRRTRGIDLKLEAELASCPADEAGAFRRNVRARGVVRASATTRLITSHGSDKETPLRGLCGGGRRGSTPRRRFIRHRPGFIRVE